MRLWMLIVLAVVFGLGFGLGITMVELGAAPAGGSNLIAEPPDPAAIANGPHAVIEQVEYDFGTMERESRKSHRFTIHNEGKAPLVLKKGDTTCRCTMFEIAKTELAPGEATAVDLEWHATVPAGSFRQSATIDCNDLARPQITFTIVGTVTSSIRLTPESLTFSGISLTESHSAQLRIFSFRPEPLEVLQHELTDAQCAEHFDVQVAAMPQDELQAEKGAVSGKLITVTVKPGLPMGPFRQKIRLRLNTTDEPMDVPIEGTTVSDLVIVGRGWDDARGLLTFDTISRREGAKAALYIVAHGLNRGQIHPRVKEVTPDVLKVSIGQPSEAVGDAPIRVPITVEIPPGSRPAAHLGGEGGKLGEILIETGLAEPETIKMKVRFAVED